MKRNIIFILLIAVVLLFAGSMTASATETLYQFPSNEDVTINFNVGTYQTQTNCTWTVNPANHLYINDDETGVTFYYLYSKDEYSYTDYDLEIDVTPVTISANGEIRLSLSTGAMGTFVGMTMGGAIGQGSVNYPDGTDENYDSGLGVWNVGQKYHLRFLYKDGVAYYYLDGTLLKQKTCSWTLVDHHHLTMGVGKDTEAMFSNLYINNDGSPQLDNIMTDVYFNLDDITNGVSMQAGSVQNISIYDYNRSIYYNITNPPNAFDYAFWSNDTIRITSYATNYIPINKNYTIDNSILIYAPETGYYYGGNSPGYKNETFGYAKVAYVYNYTTDNKVLLYGQTLDQYGVKIPGLELWLKNATNGAIIDHTFSDATWGHFGLYVDKDLGPYNYTIIVNYPGYGNLTPLINYDGAAFEVGNPFNWPGAWTSPNNQQNNDPNSQLNIDTLLQLTYVPTVTPVPSAAASVPTPPSGYNSIYGDIYNVQTGQNIAGVPVWLKYQNGTIIEATTTSTSGSYVFTFKNDQPAQMLSVVPGSTTKYGNTSKTAIIQYPFSVGTSYRCDIGLLALADYSEYEISGYIYNGVTMGRISGGTLTMTDSIGTVISTVATGASGEYEMLLSGDIAFGLYNFTYSATGYYTVIYQYNYPNDFIIRNNVITKNVGMIPEALTTSTVRVHAYSTGTGYNLPGAGVGLYYKGNGSLRYDLTTGSDGIAIFNFVNNDEYVIKVSKSGYTQVEFYLNVTTAYSYFVDAGLVPVVTPTPYPTSSGPTPTATPTPGYNALTSFYALFTLLGLDLATAQIICGFVFVILGAVAMAIGASKAGITANGTLLMGLGGGAGFVINCLLGIWPAWLLLVGAFIVVIFLVFMFTRGNSGGP